MNIEKRWAKVLKYKLDLQELQEKKEEYRGLMIEYQERFRSISQEEGKMIRTLIEMI